MESLRSSIRIERAALIAVNHARQLIGLRAMTTAPSPRERKVSAQGMVEFALALPFLLVLILGLIEAGRLLFIYSATQTASREGARYGSAAGDLNAFTTRYQGCSGIR